MTVEELENELQQKLALCVSDEERCEVYRERGALNFNYNLPLAKKIVGSYKQLAQQIGSVKELSVAHQQSGIVSILMGDFADALSEFQQSLAFATQEGNIRREANLYDNIAAVYFETFLVDEAIEYFEKSIEKYQKGGYTELVNQVRDNLAAVYFRSGLIEKAISLLNDMYEEGVKSEQLYLNMASQYLDYGDLNKVENFLEQCAELINDKTLMTQRITYILLTAQLNTRKGNFDLAEEQIKKASEMAEAFERSGSLGEVFSCRGELSLAKQDWANAEYWYLKALNLARQLTIKQHRIESLNKLKEVYSKQGKYKEAFEFAEEYIASEKEVKEEQTKTLQRMLDVKQKYALIQKEKELEENKNLELEQKNSAILQSINYAWRLQTAILPPQRIIKQYLPKSFILYLPKDIVAGDFYWMEVLGDIVLFAACDCTGHGVPGAMVSVICHNALNRAVREFGLNQPASILNKVRDLVVENFKSSEHEIADGMDASLCAYDRVTKRLQWTGANNPLWLLRNGVVYETKGDKQPIGKTDYSRPFTNHHIELKEGDNIYLFTDGYADQFGGEDGKKLGRKRFKELLMQIQTLPVSGQGKELERFLSSYRGKMEQVDDILVMGVSV